MKGARDEMVGTEDLDALGIVKLEKVAQGKVEVLDEALEDCKERRRRFGQVSGLGIP